MYSEDEIPDGCPPHLLVYGSEEALSSRLDRVYKTDSRKEMGRQITLMYRVQRFFKVMRGFHEVRVPPTNLHKLMVDANPCQGSLDLTGRHPQVCLSFRSETELPH